MVHFRDWLGIEKNPDLPMEIKETYEIRMIHWMDQQNVEKAGEHPSDKANSLWGRFKRWLLAIAKRERL